MQNFEGLKVACDTCSANRQIDKFSGLPAVLAAIERNQREQENLFRSIAEGEPHPLSFRPRINTYISRHIRGCSWRAPSIR